MMSVHVVDHPIAQHALLALRNKTSTHEQFRRLSRRISIIVTTEATRDLPVVRATVDGPLESVDGQLLRGDIVVVPVLRAGMGMLEAVMDLIPDARVGYIGLQRDERTAIASQYYSKLPDRLEKSYVLMIDPMLATGGSAVAALDLLQSSGAKIIRMICIVAAPEGVALVEKHHPGVAIYTPVIDDRLNDHKYIVPGLGDFGDRLYGIFVDNGVLRKNEFTKVQQTLRDKSMSRDLMVQREKTETDLQRTQASQAVLQEARQLLWLVHAE